MPIRPNTSSTIPITSILLESALPRTEGVPSPRQPLNGASHPHQAPHLIRRITSSMRLSPSKPLTAARPRAHLQPRPLTTDGLHPTSSCHHRFRFRSSSSSTTTLLRHSFSQTLGQTDSFHKKTPIREGWIPSTGAGAARMISGFIMANRPNTHKTHTTQCLRSHAESAKMTLSSIITRTNRSPSTISPHCLRYPPHRSRISGRSTSRRTHAGTGRGRWMILICI